MNLKELDILMVIEGEIATTYLIEQILTACADHGIRYRKQFLDKLRVADIKPNTIPLFIRCADPLLESWVELLTEAQHPYLFYIDDNFWEIKGKSPLARYYQHPLVRHSLEYAVSNADTIITNSKELASFILRFNDRIKVLPAFFDFDVIEGITAQPTDEIRIGFAGSPSRVDDLDIISPIINPILDRYPSVVFEFAGVFPKGVNASDRVRFFPHVTDYREFIRFQAGRNWAVGLAPLADHEANRCKTDNKYREYGACGIAGVYSAIAPYIHSVQADVTGVLVDNAIPSWLNAVTDLLGNPNKRAALGESARKHVKDRYCVRSVAGSWAECFRGVDDSLHNQRIKSLKKTTSMIKQLSRRIGKLKLQIAIAYYEGGIPLVFKRSVRRLSRIIVDPVDQEEYR